MNKSTSTLIDHFKNQNKTILTYFAKLHKMPGYSTCNKEQLCEKLSAYLVNEKEVLHFLTYLGEDEIKLLQDAKNSRDSLLCRRLVESGYGFVSKEGDFTFPVDFKDLFSEEFWELQKRNSLLLDCLETAGYLYGAVPFQNMMELYASVSEDSISEEELCDFIQSLPGYFQHFVIKDSFIVYHTLVANDLYEKIRLCQGATPYYYPDKASICHLSRYGYMEDEHTHKLKTYLVDKMNVFIHVADRYISILQSSFRQGGSMKDALDYLMVTASINREDPSFLSLVNEVFSHSRLLLSRGHTASEKQVQILHPKKIYPNSPCPCGSGKKYKKCCARLK